MGCCLSLLWSLCRLITACNFDTTASFSDLPEHQLWPPPDDKRRTRMDVIFFHGFQFAGESSTDAWRSTWTQRGCDDVCWAKEWLPFDLGKDVRILSVSYNAHVITSPHHHVSEIAHNLFETLIKRCKWDCPIVLIGHSFGGLVLKSLVVKAKKMSSIKDPKGSLTRAAVDHAKAFLNNVRGVVFYAVPHVGSYKFAKYVNNLLRSNDKHHARIMENVQPCQRDMEELSEEFENFLKEKKVNVFAFGEGKPMNAGILVHFASAQRLAGGHSYKVEDANHMEVCKPTSQDHISYTLLLRFIKDVATENPIEAHNLSQEIFGLESYVERVEMLLTSAGSDASPCYLGVCGMGGVGKTFLLRKVCGRPKVQAHFQGATFIWLTVGQNPDILSLYRSISDVMGSELHLHSNMVDYKQKLEIELTQKRVFLVLDDVWKDEDFDALDLGKGEGSVTLLTTRIKSILQRPCVSQEHMKRLSPEDSLSLFCVHAFGTSSSVPQRLEALAKSMAEECGGLPLAPKVIGAAMFGKKSDEREWKPLLQKLNESRMQGDRTLNIGDTALFQAGNAPPFIGILRKVTVEKDDQVKLSVNWLYRPADVKLAKGAALEPAPNEIFYSFHKDDISAASLLHPCKVAFLRKGVELPTGVSSFVCRRVYDTASKCLWWLTDRDYTDEHQQEVDLLLERTKLEMQAAVQSGGPSPRALTGPISSSPQPKVSAESVQNATIYSLPGKGKKRERADQNLDPSKRERNVKFDDPDTSTLKRERSMKLDEIAAILDKDGGLLNVGVVERLVQLMPNDPHDGTGKVADVLAHRTMLAGVIAATENAECLNQFVSLGGLRLLDEWLQEAHKGKVGDGGSPKECDKGVEDLLLALLRALDRLPVDLKALKTCSVGKSVNHLRSHKNLEIQKKARRLVDVWKKRVDAEMKASGEAKPGSGHGISWSYKQSAAELVHPLTKIGSGGIPEVAVKSSGAFAGNAKVTLNGTNSGDAPVKPLSVVPAVSKTASALSPDLPAAKDSNNSKLPALNISPDMPANPVKEEKSSSSSHTLSNGHSWGSAAGKGSGNTTWKEDVKTSVPLCVNGSSKASSAGSPRLPNAQNKVMPGASVSGGSKEAGGGKPLVWTRSAGTEKAVGSVATPETSSSQQRLIVRIPNPGKSPAQTSGGAADVAAPASRSSSPSVLERHSSTSLVDVLETKNRPQTGSQAASSPEGAIDAKAGDGGKSGTGSIEDKMKPQSNAAPVNALESEKKISNESAPGLVGVKEEADCMSKETLTSSCSSAFRGAGEALPQVVDGGNDANTASAAGSVEDGPLGHSQVSPMEVDDGAMSLLATAAAAAEVGAIGGGTGTLEKADTGGQMLKGEQEANVNSSVDAEPGHMNGSFCGNVAMEIDGAPQSKDHSEPGITQSALNHETPSTDGSKAGGKIEQKEQHDGGSMERQGSVSHSDANKEVESLSVEQAGGGERGVKKLIVQECAGQACEASSDTPSTLMSMAELPVENRRAVEVTAKASNEQHPSVRDYSVSGMNDLESKLTSKFGKRDLISEERNLLRTLSKESSARDLCNGVGGAERDYRANMGSSLESRMQEEKNGKRRGQEVGQLFGRRGDSDAQRIAELVSGFPEEDVLEVARQAANEVEQMQENSKPVSSSSSERDGQNAQTKGTPNGGETKDITTSDTAGRELEQVSPTEVDENAKTGSDAQDQQHGSRVFAAHINVIEKSPNARIEEAAKVVQAACSEDGEQVDQAMMGERTLEKSPASRGEETDGALEGGGRGEMRRVDTRQPLGGSFFQPNQLEGVGEPALLSSSVSQPIVNPAVTHNSQGDSTTPVQPLEGTAHSDAAVGGSDTSERLDFDLNEGFAGEDSPQDDAITVPPTSAALIIQPAHPIASTASASGVAAPIAVLAATKGTFIPPLSPMRIKGDLGWKGSAATSAFRPAEPRRTPDRQQSNAESLASDANLSLNANAVKQARPLLEFDLNVADDRVMEDVGVAATTLSSQGSVLGISLQNQSLPSSSVSGVTFIKQESPFLTFLKPESSSSAHPLSNGGYGSLRASPGQAPSSSGYGAARPNLDLDLNRMDDSEECGTPFYSDARAAEGAASLAPSNNSTSKPARRVMDFDLNDGPSFEEVGVDDPASQSLPLRKPASNAGIAVGMSGTRMRGEGMNLSSWLSPPGNSFPGVTVPAFPPAPVSDPGYSVAAAAAAQSFLNVGSASATAVGPFNAEIFRAGPTLSAPPAVVYPPAERVTFGTYGPFPVFGGSAGFLSSSLPFPTASAPFVDTSRPVPFPAISSQLGSQPTVSSAYVRPPLLMGMTEAVAADNSGGAWSRRSLDLNAGPELADTDSMRDDVMHGRLPPLHPGGPAVFNEQMRATLAQVSANSGLTTPLKRKEPEGGWNCYTGNGGFKQATWR